ncbi:unnamed protein product [Brachionus calyciflorus]|uniref:BTB domain-containing protein n=1 Tax=Brachionus calyciflorus TaxID=104777 RepID=A0A813V7D9_9BILA|nr:unnamed protein product [Brachionus calyciflorus]
MSLKIDLDELNNLLSEDEINGLDYENLSTDGSYSCLQFRSTRSRLDKFLLNLKEFLDDEKFCDVILKTESTSFNNSLNVETTPRNFHIIKAHKIILASASPYFKAMFAGGFRENRCCEEVFIDHISHNILKVIIDFIYSNRILIIDNNVQSLLVASKMLQIEDIVNACCVFLKAERYMVEHFCEIINSDEFLHLNEKQLCKLLIKDELSVRCESVVFKAVVDWVKFDPEKRRSHLDHLFQCVRFHFLPPKFLKDQMKNNEIFKLEECGKSRQYLQKVCDDLISHKPCKIGNPRQPCTFSLFVLGGYQRQSISLVECFKKQTMTWERCSDMNLPRSGVACVSLALYIYVIGGRNNSLYGNTDCADVECYDPFVNSWKKCCPMSVPRSRAGVGVIDGLIYAVGGANSCTCHKSVERYHSQENRWEPVASMNMARIGLGCAVVNRLLYAVGGYDGTNRLNQVECYNPDSNVWTMVASMNVPRSGAGIIAWENYIYAVGGYTNNLQLNSVERYDPQTNQWSFVSSMNVPRSALACVVWNGKIIAIGGYNGNEFLSSIELYDPSTDTWTDGPPMTSERSGHGAVVTVESKFV